MGQALKWLSSLGPSVNVDNVCSVSVDELLLSMYENQQPQLPFPGLRQANPFPSEVHNKSTEILGSIVQLICSI